MNLGRYGLARAALRMAVGVVARGKAAVKKILEAELQTGIY